MFSVETLPRVPVLETCMTLAASGFRIRSGVGQVTVIQWRAVLPRPITRAVTGFSGTVRASVCTDLPKSQVGALDNIASAS